MFSRALTTSSHVFPAGRSVLNANIVEQNVVQKRFVSSKSLRMRMVAVNNIKKITKAMKMVASAKLRKTQDALIVARNFVAPMNTLWPCEETIVVNATDEAKIIANEVKGKKYLFVAITADRGLCGSVNSAIGRAGKNKLNIITKAADVDILLFGEKGRAAFERGFNRNFSLAVSDYTKLKKSTFTQAATLTSIFLSQTGYDVGEILYNRFKNLMTFDTVTQPIQPMKTLLEESKLYENYEVEGGEADVLENLAEFRTAVRFFGLFAESETVELSQRVNAMSSSSKNAGEMLDSLRLKYNRGRQAKITTELIEIISGATAAESSNKQE
jgi:ATP synthase F1 gamma subunit